MSKVFISYRRSDKYDANRMAKYLRREFGHDNIFFDTESLQAGEQWPESIKTAIDESSVLLILIGSTWLHTQDKESGRRRIDLEKDWVRLEISRFFKNKESNKELAVLPILLNGARLPRADHLDYPLSLISGFQAVEIQSSGSSADFVALKQILTKNRISPLEIPPVVTPVMTMPPSQLTEEEETEFSEKYPGWRVIEKDKPGVPGDFMRELYRVFEFKNYDDAWKFMTAIDEKGIRPYQHHPRWQNTYNRVEVWLCTFNIGHKPSNRDTRLAKIMEEEWQAIVGDVFS
jgi:pterin-4a-carbinolamine dehydratase